MNDRLVVGCDGSDASVAAARWAGAEAEIRNAAVRVVSSYSVTFAADPYGMTAAYLTPAELDRVRLAATEKVSSVVAGVAHQHPRVGVDLAVVDEDAASLLLHEGQSSDLLVVGSSGLGSVKGILLGSVVSSLLHECPCPLVVVPEKSHGTGAGVVVGVDGSESSRSALDWAADEATRRGVALRVLHAWEYPYRATTGRDFAEVDAATLLEDAVRTATERCPNDVSGELVEGGPVAALLAAGETAELLVVGSRRRGGFRSMLFGSVAHGVAAHATTPVVVLH